MTDRDEYRQAIAAIIHVLTTSEGDNDHKALCIIAALIGHGWRPTNAQPWHPPQHPPTPPTDDYRAARAIIQGHTDVDREAEELHAEHHPGYIVPSLDSCPEHDQAEYEQMVRDLHRRNGQPIHDGYHGRVTP
jgi:hypothetical protein